MCHRKRPQYDAKLMYFNKLHFQSQNLRKIYGRFRDLIKHYEVSLSLMLHVILGHDHIQ